MEHLSDGNEGDRGEGERTLHAELERSRFELNHRLVQLESLYQAGLALSASLANRDLQMEVLRLAVAAVDARCGFLRLLEPGGAGGASGVEPRLESIGLEPAALERALVDPTVQSAADEAVRLGAPTQRGPAALPAGFPGRHLLLVPLGDDGILGVFDKETREGVRAFTELDAHLLEMIAQQAAMALTNARLYQHTEDERNLTAGILDSIADGVLSVDLSGTILRANPVAQELLGDECRPLPGARAVDILRCAGCDRVAEALPRTLADGDSRQVEGEHLAATGGPLTARITPLRTPQGATAGAVVALEDLSDRFRLESMFKQYASDQVVDMLLASDHLPSLGGEVCEATVMFVDIVGSTELLGRIGGAEMVSLLNDCFTRLVARVLDHGGTLDKYTGDGFMAVFGAPLSRDDDTARAAACALAIVDEMSRFARDRGQDLGIKVGISRGPVVAGNIGSPRRLEYSVIGPDVVLAARLCDHAAAGQVLVSSHVLEQLDDSVGRQHLGRHIFKGVRDSLDVYRILAAGQTCVIEPPRAAGERRVALDLPMAPGMELIASDTIRSLCRQLRVGSDVVDEVCTAVVEVCINAFEHSQSKSGRLRLELLADADRLTIVVSDQGHGFDVDAALERARARRARGERRRGWGLELISEFMDDMEIESGAAGTTVTLVKNLPPTSEKTDHA